MRSKSAAGITPFGEADPSDPFRALSVVANQFPEPTGWERPGRPLDPNAVSKAFAKRRSVAELSKIRLHDVRHAHATLALQAGVHRKVVSDRLGHGDIALTLNTYSHAVPALQESAADTIAALISG